MKLKKGNRVVCWGAFDDNRRIIGKIGTVLHSNNYVINVEFDDWIDGHDSDGKGKDGYCWNFFNEEGIKLLTKKDMSDKEIVQFIDKLLKEELKTLKVKSCDYEMEIEDNFLEIGCQRIKPLDALKMADHIEKAYGHLR